MFTNLSNHPCAGWAKEQYDFASSRWGRIVDLPFPQIGADMSEERIKGLVREYLKRLSPKEEGPVFVAGEYAFTYAMVDELLRRGYRTVYAESENKVSITKEEDGASRRRIDRNIRTVYGSVMEDMLRSRDIFLMKTVNTVLYSACHRGISLSFCLKHCHGSGGQCGQLSADRGTSGLPC